MLYPVSPVSLWEPTWRPWDRWQGCQDTEQGVGATLRQGGEQKAPAWRGGITAKALWWLLRQPSALSLQETGVPPSPPTHCGNSRNLCEATWPRTKAGHLDLPGALVPCSFICVVCFLFLLLS